LVTELIRLTLKKLQSALEDNCINNDDLVAMALTVDAGAVSAALQAARGTAAATCPKSSSTLPVDSVTDAGGHHSPAPSSTTDRPLVSMMGDYDQADVVSASELAAVAKEVLSDLIKQSLNDSSSVSVWSCFDK